MFCPAKINLFLKLIKKRSDGYFNLESVFAFLDLSDELHVEKSDKFSLKITGEFAEFIELENNLFTKILDYFAERFSISKNIKIELRKNIPVGAGLGGGSSDAAFFIMELNRIFELNLSKNQLQKIVLNFGSDIPFFFEGRASIVRGRGEIITEFPEFKPLKILLVNPRIHCSTKEIFSAFNGNFSKEISDEEIRKKNILELIKDSNDLTDAAISSCAEIGEILEEFKKSKAIASKMSGSGATCFAVFEKDEELFLAKENFAKKFPGFFVRETKIIYG